MKRSQRQNHEIGNIYMKALAGLPPQRWQRWQLVKFIERDDELPHVVLQEVGGKTTRTMAMATLNDPSAWVKEEMPAETTLVA